MRKISGQLLSSKPISLSRASKLISRFAAVDNGSSAAISLYLQRTADAFNHLVQLHNKRPQNSDVCKSPGPERARKTEANTLERRGKKEKRTVVEEAAGANPNENEVKVLETEEKEESKEDTQMKKKKKRKIDSHDDSKEESKKRRRT